MALTEAVGGTTSDTYATEAEYTARATALGWTLSGDNQVNLRNAAIALDRAYIWKGRKTIGPQALEFPRIISEYVDGFSVPSDEIPTPIKNAQMEMAYLIQQGATPFATLEGGSVLRKREKVDVIEEDTTYSTPRERAAYPLIDSLVSAYAKMKRGTSAGSVPLQRA